MRPIFLILLFLIFVFVVLLPKREKVDYFEVSTLPASCTNDKKYSTVYLKKMGALECAIDTTSQQVSKMVPRKGILEQEIYKSGEVREEEIKVY